MTKAEDTRVADLTARLEAVTGDLEKKLAEANQKIEALERQPMPGGPMLRAVSKAQQPPLRKQEPAAPPARDLNELRQLAATEPNPALRQQYIRELMAAEGIQ